MIINGEHWRPVFGSVDDALDASINRDASGAIIQVVTEALDEAEALLLLARRAEDYERINAACRALARHLSPIIGSDEVLTFDILRELSGLATRHRYSQHAKRLQAARKQISHWKQATLDWAAEAERHAEKQLEEALRDAGFIPV